MRVDIIDTIESLNQVRENWERVYRADPEAHYFLSWTWMANWFEPRAGQWLILAAKPDDETPNYTAFFPLLLSTRLDADGNFRHSILMGGSYFAVYTGFICHPDYQTSALQAFGKQIRSLNWTHFHLDDAFASEARLDTLLQSFPPSDFATSKTVRGAHVTDTGEDIDHDIYVFVKLPGDWDEFLANNLGKETRKNARKYLRKVDAGPEYRVSVADADTIDRDLETTLRFWQIQWESKNPAYAEYLLSNARHMIRRCFDDGTVFLPILWKGKNPIGANIAFADWEKRTLLSFLGSRDLGIKKPPPGFVLHAYSMRWAIANGFTTYDIGTGNFSYKYSFGAEEHVIERRRVSTQTGANQHAPLDSRTLSMAFQKVQAHHRRGNLYRAEQGCRKILDFDSNHASATKLLEKIKADTNPASLLAEAKNLLKRKNLAEAESLYEVVLERDPENIDARHLLGVALLGRGLAEAAESHIRRVIELEPTFASAHNNLGLVLMALDRASEALASYEQALALRPDYPRAFNNRGVALLNIGRVEEAVASFDSAIALRPDYAKAIANRDAAMRRLPIASRFGPTA